jgi:hypothetical protein
MASMTQRNAETATKIEDAVKPAFDLARAIWLSRMGV